MDFLFVVLGFALVVGLIAFIATDGDWRDRLTEGLGGAGAAGAGCFFVLFQLATLAVMGWFAWKILHWLFG